MIFDKIIMNPPYSRNLHLKVLEKAIKYLKDDNSVCVNLSPIRWLQDPLAKYKKNSDYNKFEKSIAQHIESLEIVKAEKASKMFNAELWTDLSIYTFVKCKTDFVLSQSDFYLKKVILPYMNSKSVQTKISKDRGSFDFSLPFIRVSELHGHKGKKDMYEFFSSNREIVYSQKETSCGHTINFSTELARDNFFDYCFTSFIRYICVKYKTDMNVPFSCLPWLGDVENPRTHKIGYESDWANEDLCKIFGITGFISDTEAEPESEWEEILKTMKDFRGQRL